MKNRKAFVEPELHAEATLANGTLVSGSQFSPAGSTTSNSYSSSITSSD